jgi:hypothetical protein
MGTLSDAFHRAAIHKHSIVEAFPSSFLGLMIREPTSLGARRRNRSDVFFAHLVATGELERLVNRLLPQRRLIQAFDAINNHDDRAALICALTALCIGARDYVAVGDDQGWIALPPKDFIQPWAWHCLTSNASAGHELVQEQ